MKVKKILLWSLASVAFLGAGYFVYRKIADRNKDFIKDGNFTVVVDKSIETEVTKESSNENSVADYEEETPEEIEGKLVNDNWNDLGGYYYIFPNGEQHYYLADGTLVQIRDKDHNLIS